MKPQELMIGDLISMGGVIRVVTGIHDKETENGVDLITTMIPGHTFPDSNLSFRASYCYPIPITPEILEKNGFVQNPRSKSRRSHQICTDSVYISWWRGRLNILFKPFIGHSTNHVNVDGKYVHELQHALRICGIDKEIVI